MKSTLLFLGSILFLLAACTKKDKTTTPTPTPVAHPYYFKFNLNGTAYNFNSNQPQFVYLYNNEFGGYQGSTDMNLFPSVGLRLTWLGIDTLKESDVMALTGKTIYFNDTTIRPEITYDANSSLSDSWTSVDTSKTSYYVKIATVKYLKIDTALTTLVRTYELTGTCSALMTDDNSHSTFKELTSGDFHFIVSRADH